jgi:hypothetical protein
LPATSVGSVKLSIAKVHPPPVSDLQVLRNEKTDTNAARMKMHLALTAGTSNFMGSAHDP